MLPQVDLQCGFTHEACAVDYSYFLKQNFCKWGVVLLFPDWRASLHGAVCLQNSVSIIYLLYLPGQNTKNMPDI